jgi:hypothetical protein
MFMPLSDAVQQQVTRLAQADSMLLAVYVVAGWMAASVLATPVLALLFRGAAMGEPTERQPLRP